MQTQIHKILRPLHLKQKIDEVELSNFKNAIDTLKTNTLNKKDESEEHIKSFLNDFFKSIGYANYQINTHNKIDLTISIDDIPQILIEVKREKNKKEMVSCDNLNTKAMHELILYYLTQKNSQNYHLKHLIITNNLDWFVFDASEFDKLISHTKLKKIFDEKIDKSLSNNTNENFYDICKNILSQNENLLKELEYIYFDLQSNFDDKQIKLIYKLLSPLHLLKNYSQTDANTLNKNFYDELLYIIGLEEYKEDGKTLIGRQINRQYGTILENIISKITTEHTHITNEEQKFEIALNLIITWLNRILFLKLLEAKLIKIHNGDYIRFMSYNIIDDYDKLNTLFFEVLAIKKNDRNSLELKELTNIPYLNSSLFETTVEEKQYERISNLKDDIKIKKYKSSVLTDQDDEINTLEYLLTFLDVYDFGTDKDSEYKEDKLINSAVLGLVFEKLNGYKDGSFYTPSYITMYMTRQTLHTRMLQLYNTKYNTNHSCIDELEQDNYNKIEISHLIDSITVCDPSVGSGHYLVSMLNEILALKARLDCLLDENNKNIKVYINVYNDELYILDNDGDVFEYKKSKNGNISPASHRIQKTIFTQKQKIIENQLFGVDINPNSAKITRLRLWIELLKHSYYDDNKELVTLPNIDINIKVGNSLINKYQLKDIATKGILKDKIEEYKKYVSLYKDTNDRVIKHTIDNKIKEINKLFDTKLKDGSPKLQELKKLLNGVGTGKNHTKGYIDEYGFFGINEEMLLISNNPIYLRLYATYGSEYSPMDSSLFGDDTKLDDKQLKVHEKNRDKALKQILQKYQDIKDIENSTIYNNSFEWRFEFPEVLDDDGEFLGFDIVVGNPPYIRQEEIKELKSTLQKIYTVYNGTADIYVYFYERGTNILKQDGILSYITSNKYTRAKYGRELREYILKNDILEYIELNGIKVFDEATVDTSIMTIQKSSTKDFFYYLELKKDFDKKNISTDNKQLLDKSSLSFDSYTFVSSKKMALKQKIESIGTPLKEWDIKIYRGILTGYNEAFIIDGKTKDELIAQDSKNAEIIKPLLRGRDIKKYEVNFADKWLINVHNGIKSKKLNPIDIDDYPTIKQHLDKYYHYLEKRTDKGDTPYNLRNCAYLDDFEKEKIVYPETTVHPNVFMYDDKNYFLDKTCFKLCCQSIKYINAILNSSVMLYFMKNTVRQVGLGFQLSKIFIELLPIPKIPIEEQKPFEILVDEIIDKKSKGIDTKELENKIDDMVYKLYNLTDDEINIIQNSL